MNCFLCCHFRLLTASGKCTLWFFFFVSDVFLSPRLPSWMLSIFDHVLMSLAEQCLLSRKKKYSLCPHTYCSWHLYNLYIIKWFIFNVHMCPCLFWVRGSKASVFWCSKAVPGFVVVDAFRFGEDRCTSLKSPGASPPWQTGAKDVQTHNSPGPIRSSQMDLLQASTDPAWDADLLKYGC